jgi:hypothetical protein
MARGSTRTNRSNTGVAAAPPTPVAAIQSGPWAVGAAPLPVNWEYQMDVFGFVVPRPFPPPPRNPPPSPVFDVVALTKFLKSNPTYELASMCYLLQTSQVLVVLKRPK